MSSYMSMHVRQEILVLGIVFLIVLTLSFMVYGAEPTNNQRLTQCFGCGFNNNRGHLGEDYGAVTAGVAGDSVFAIEQGEVIISTLDGTADRTCQEAPRIGWGNYVVIRHEYSQSETGYLYSIYAHLDRRLVVSGERVTEGQPIGIMGCTGFATAVHLHIGIVDRNPPGRGYFGEDFNDNVISDGARFYYRPSLFFSSFVSISTPQDRSLVRPSNADTVYWLQNKQWYWVVNESIMNMMAGLPGWGWNQIFDGMHVTELGDWFTQNGYSPGPPIVLLDPQSDGLLIRYPPESGDIAVLENGQRRHILSLDEFNRRGYNLGDVIEVSKALWDYIPQGVPIGGRNDTSTRCPTPPTLLSPQNGTLELNPSGIDFRWRSGAFRTSFILFWEYLPHIDDFELVYIQKLRV